MNYSELRDKFLDLLNRTDCTEAKADRFIAMGLRRIDRLLKAGIQRTTLETTIDGTWGGSEPIPEGFLGIVSVAINGDSAHRITNTQSGYASGYIIRDDAIEFTPNLGEGDEITIVYYKALDRNPGDEDSPLYIDAFDDLVLYSALVYAGDHFVMEQAPGWGATFGTLLEEVQIASDVADLAGGYSITPYGGGVA